MNVERHHIIDLNILNVFKYMVKECVICFDKIKKKNSVF